MQVLNDPDASLEQLEKSVGDRGYKTAKTRRFADLREEGILGRNKRPQIRASKKFQ